MDEIGNGGTPQIVTVIDDIRSPQIENDAVGINLQKRKQFFSFCLFRRRKCFMEGIKFRGESLRRVHFRRTEHSCVKHSVMYGSERQRNHNLADSFPAGGKKRRINFHAFPVHLITAVRNAFFRKTTAADRILLMRRTIRRKNRPALFVIENTVVIDDRNLHSDQLFQLPQALLRQIKDIHKHHLSYTLKR